MGLAEAAKTDLATRYTLYAGNTFVLDATGYDPLHHSQPATARSTSTTQPPIPATSPSNT